LIEPVLSGLGDRLELIESPPELLVAPPANSAARLSVRAFPCVYPETVLANDRFA
jgi:hypothetical protein